MADNSLVTKTHLRQSAENTVEKLNDLSTAIGTTVATHDTNTEAHADIRTVMAAKVDKVSGKGLSTNDYTMTDTQTVTPSKALSNCAHGWLLLWSDYNPGDGVANTDFCTTMIPNFAHTGQKWNGGQFLCNIPRYADASGEAVIVKTLQVYDAKLMGSSFNTVSPRNDVVLRAVYEF